MFVDINKFVKVLVGKKEKSGNKKMGSGEFNGIWVVGVIKSCFGCLVVEGWCFSRR